MEYIIIQAGGKGTRLEYLTQNKPKALVPVENLPMIFHLFNRFSDKRFVIIADYKKDVLRKYLASFARVKYQIVDADGSGTCGGVKQAIDLLPENEPFMLIWSDLILPSEFKLPEEYKGNEKAENDYVGLSQSFVCRWKYENEVFVEEKSDTYGVAGFFLFSDKKKLQKVPKNGELVRWLGEQRYTFKTIGLSGTREFGVLEEYKKIETPKYRPFNRITVDGEVLTKEPIDAQGIELAKLEVSWYEKAKDLCIHELPQIYNLNPLQMEYIKGKNIYECNLTIEEKRSMLATLVKALKKVHRSGEIPVDTFSIQEAYYNKTIRRLSQIENLIPFSKEKVITVNGKKCRNVLYYLNELETKLDKLKSSCEKFAFIHGDCTFSNLMVREDNSPVFIDPRGYFGYTELFGDIRYDWAKMYYSIVGNYDQFNLKRFRLTIDNDQDIGVSLNIQSNCWEELEGDFFKLTGANPYEIKLLHAVIWLSLTTYAWQDYDSICGAFYNGIYYLEDVL